MTRTTSNKQKQLKSKKQPTALEEQLRNLGFLGSSELGCQREKNSPEKTRKANSERTSPNPLVQNRGKRKRKRRTSPLQLERKANFSPMKSLFEGEEPKFEKAPPASGRNLSKITEERIREMWKKVSISDHNTFREVNPSSNDILDMASRFSALRKAVDIDSIGDDETLLYLGFDFGSTSTKLVFSTPYIERFPKFAVPAPECLRLEEDPYIWTSSIWETPSGNFSLLPLEECHRHNGFKVDLMAQFDVMEDVRSKDVAHGCVLATTAYFALMIAQALGWLRNHHSQVWQGAPVEYFVNFGFPASSLDKPETYNAYYRCAKAALALVEELEVENGQPHVTRSLVEAALEAVNEDEPDDDDEWGVVPEITAAVAGFANSVERRDSLYMIVDVGGVTVDASIFKLFGRARGQDRCPIYSAAVRRRGVEVLKAWVSLEGEKEAFQLSITNQIAGVIQHAFKRFPNESVWGADMTVFFTGGGTASKIHQQALYNAAERASWPSWCNTQLEIKELPHEQIVAPGMHPENHHRLLVAIGLARNIDDIPLWTTQSNIEAPGERRRDYSDNFVGPEQV